MDSLQSFKSTKQHSVASAKKFIQSNLRWKNKLLTTKVKNNLDLFLEIIFVTVVKWRSFVLEHPLWCRLKWNSALYSPKRLSHLIWTQIHRPSFRQEDFNDSAVHCVRFSSTNKSFLSTWWLVVKAECVQSCFCRTGQLARGFDDPCSRYQAFLKRSVLKNGVACISATRSISSPPLMILG